MTAVVTFDCWQTLLHEHDGSVSHGLRVQHLASVATALGRVTGEHEAQAALALACSRQYELWSRGQHAGAMEIAVWSLEALEIRTTDRGEVAELAEAFSIATLESTVEALPGSLETLVSLARAGVRTALVCDTGLSPGRVVRRLLDRCGLASELTAFAFSDEVGVAKPSPRIFEHALQQLAAAPSEATHVGDLLRTDVAGARRVGMRTVRIRAAHDDSSELPEADQVVDDHAGLREALLERIDRDRHAG